MPDLQNAYRSALIGISAVWFIVAALAVGGITAWQGWDAPPPIPGGRVGLFISIASLVIAITSLFPGLTARKTDSEELEQLEAIGNRFMIGMTIRLPGTVALFFASSYYFDASALWIAVWVLLWHAVLLATEVTILLRPLPKC